MKEIQQRMRNVVYAFHGKELAEIPNSFAERPSKEFLRWHLQI